MQMNEKGLSNTTLTSFIFRSDPPYRPFSTLCSLGQGRNSDEAIGLRHGILRLRRLCVCSGGRGRSRKFQFAASIIL